jgi:hypothetical protein
MVVPVLVVGAVALGLAMLPPTTQSPFAAAILAHTLARLAVCPAPADMVSGKVRIETLHVAGDGFGVVYSAACMNDGIAAPAAGFLVYMREGWRWQNLGGEDISYYDAGCFLPGIAGQKLCCLVSSGYDGNYTAIFGLVLAVNVEIIEIAFADGEVLRSTIVNHRFAIARPGVMKAGVLRALAADGLVLETFPLDLSAGAQMRGTTGCRA